MTFEIRFRIAYALTENEDGVGGVVSSSTAGGGWRPSTGGRVEGGSPGERLVGSWPGRGEQPAPQHLPPHASPPYILSARL